jgi:Fe-S cluster biosynthesis and repair protein YggX
MDTTLTQRIGQWEKMTRDDPENAMGWFSLGGAYKDAERQEDAARALRRAIELDAGLSRAYQLLGQLLIKSGAVDQAGDVLTRGFTVAAQRGDVMPMKAMQSLLEKIGKPVPAVAQDPAPAPLTGGPEVLDRRTNQPGPRLPDPPMRGPVGWFIYHHFSMPTWQQWIRQGTKVINELRLDFSNTQHQHIYETHMMEWLGFTMEEVEQFHQLHPRPAK